MLRDARAIENGSTIEADVCVIGAGPAGICIARELASSSLRVCLTESGGFDPELPTQQLYRGEVAGRDYYSLDSCRYRLFGGSSNRWGGLCRPLEPLDFEARSWVELSGWPFSRDELLPFYDQASELLGLRTREFNLSYWAKVAPAPELVFRDGTFENQVFQYSPQTNFGIAYRDALAAAPRLTTLLYANAVELEASRDRLAVRGVRVVSLRGNTFRVLARAIVVATGGIENPRLLLASTGLYSGGMGNEHGWVGRCFMDHPHVPVGHFLPSNNQFRRDFYRKYRYAEHQIRGVLAPSAALQRRCSLLGCSIAVERSDHTFGTAFLEWPPSITFPLVRLRRWIKERISARLAAGVADAAELGYSVPRRVGSAIRASRALHPRGAERSGAGVSERKRVYPLYIRSEQQPNPSSRVYLSDRRDSLESRLPCLDWKLGDEDTESISRCLEALKDSVESAGLGRILLPHGEERERWKDRIIGGPHHMGTTRMSRDPKKGVVDENCRVHSVHNLYVAGSSVFPTGGYANPTLTVVALALRVARRLLQEYV